MKLAFAVFALVAVASAAVMPKMEKKVADKEFLQKQKAFLELVWRVNQPVYFPNILEIGNQYNIQANLEKFNNVEVVKKFWNTYKTGMLPQGEIFSALYEKHLKEAINLYEVFYQAKDLETFYNVACWARVHVNSGQFVYALSVAILHREDTRGLVLPPPYEIYPNLFLDNAVIQQALRVRMLYNGKQQQYPDNTYIIQVNSTHMYPQYMYEDIEQQQQQQQNQRYYNNKYRYGGDYWKQVHPESRLSYFTEDIGVNTWYNYFHLQHPFWMGKEQGYKTNMRGERFYYIHQQILARYQLERLSNDLKEIDVLMWDQPIQVGYAPNLQYPNGQEFPIRQDNVNPTTVRTYETELVQHLERRILDAIDLGYLLTQDGKKVVIYDQNRKIQDQGIELLGEIIESTADSVNQRYFGKLYQLSLRVLGHIFDAKHQHDVAYGVLEHYITALRDPVFYRYINRMNKLFLRYKTNLPKYTRTELFYPGVKITSVDVEKLITYFDQFDIDTSAATLVNSVEEDKNLKIVARQYRLNHKAFNYKIEFDSDKTEDVVVRVFLGPKYDAEGRVLTLNKKRQHMFEMERFVYKMQAGHNVITRNSRDNYQTTPDYTTMRTLYQQVMGALEGKNEFYIDEQVNKVGIPERLLLPKGKKGGMPFTFYVTITPRGQVEQQQETLDQYPLGYPFDRMIDVTEFMVPNFYEKDVIIFHKRQEDINNQSI